MIFKQCSNCGQNLNPKNCEVKVSEIGMTMNHPTCRGTSFLPIIEIKKRAEEKTT